MVEELILKRIEAEDELKLFCIPNIVDGEGQFNVPVEEYKRLFNTLLPWVSLDISESSNLDSDEHTQQSPEPPVMAGMLSKIAALRELCDNNITDEEA